MSIFELHAQILADDRDFVGSFIQIARERVREFVRQIVEAEPTLWSEAILDDVTTKD